MSIFVFPSTLPTAWAVFRGLTLGFSRYDLFTSVVSVTIVACLIAEGSSYWLVESTLTMSYAAIPTVCLLLQADKDYT